LLALAWLVPLAAEVPASETALDIFLRDTQTLTADFTQTIHDNLGGEVEQSRGTMAMQRPNRFHWRYTGADEQLIIADGEGLWIYDAILAQATYAPLDDVLADTPALLLSGNSEYRDGFDVVESVTQAKQSWIILAPKRTDTDFRRIRLDFTAGTLTAMVLEDSLNQRTQITFSNVTVNAELAATLFTFTAPAGVDVIGQD
jgi:outer membrane lipoprotein carrier protein